MGLRLRLLAVVFLAVLPALIMIGLNTFAAREAARQKAVVGALQQIRALASFQAERLKEARLLVGFLSRDPILGRDGQSCSQRMAALFSVSGQEAPGIFNFALADRSGNIICAAYGGGGVSIGDRPYFWQAVERRETVIGEYVLGRLVAEPVVPVAAPILGEEGLRGIALVTMNLTWMGKAMAPKLSSGARLSLFDSRGKVLVSIPEGTGELPSKERLFTHISAGQTEGSFTAATEDGDHVFVYAHIPYGDNDFFVMLDQPERSFLAEAESAFMRQILALACLLIAALTAAWVLGGTFIRGPVLHLTGAARRMASGQMGARVPLIRNDEIGQLGQAFNDMAESLAQAAEQARGREDALKEANMAKANFLSMIGHEFRSPLSIIEGAAQVIPLYLRRGAEANGEVSEEMAKIGRAVRRMSGLIDVFLAEDRMDMALSGAKMERIDLSLVVATLCEERNAMSDKRRIRFIPCEPLRVRGDWALLQVAVSNLLDNALKYSPADTMVTVKGTVGEGLALVSFTDQGEGVDMDEAERNFEKFYRSTRTDRVTGAGLGLHIVKRVAEMHKGQVWVEPGVGCGAVFTLALPLAEDPVAESEDSALAPWRMLDRTGGG